jgi:uncharacterized protein (TIGR03000 family)
VVVPADATVWIDGAPTTQTGTDREFQTPPLEPGRVFTYQVRARWTQNGQMMDQTRTAEVRAGGMTMLVFTSSAPLP